MSSEVGKKVMVQVEHLSKRYRIQRSDAWYVSLREALFEGAHRMMKGAVGKGSPSPSYDEFWALDDISFSVGEGEAVGILGRNGAGKSTLLKLLSRVTPPTRGKMVLQGSVSSLLEVGVGFHAELTARENIFFNGALMGMGRREIEKNFDSIVDFSGVEPFLDMPMKKFSSGMCARLGFAVGAHLHSDIFIVDEVLAVGDAEFQKKCMTKMGELVREGRTLFFVSHDINTLLTLCDKGIFLRGGKLVSMEPIHACAHRYLSQVEEMGLHWEGDLGGAVFRLCRVDLVGEREKKTDFFLPQDQASLKIEYLIEEPREDLIVTLRVLNAHQQTVATTRWCDASSFSTFPTGRGRHQIGFAIDMHLFHPGEYTLVFDAELHQQKPLFQDQPLLRMTICSDEVQQHFGLLEGGISLGNRWFCKGSSSHVEEGIDDTTRQREEIGVGKT